MKEFEGILQNNPQVKNLDAVVKTCFAIDYQQLTLFLTIFSQINQAV